MREESHILFESPGLLLAFIVLGIYYNAVVADGDRPPPLSITLGYLEKLALTY